jgi:SAM-dependent methyltransferase
MSVGMSPPYCTASRANIAAMPRQTRLSPAELRVERQYQFVADVVRGAARVLEVGCGRGDLARRLGADGIAVTAIDRELPEVRPGPGVRFVHADICRYDDAPFDAVVFTASLHHIDPLADAIDRAAKLLVPGGTLIVDDFDLDAPRPTTARWYYETQELLVAAGLYAHDRIDHAPDDNPDPRMRWLDAHVHDPPLATGRKMIAAIAARFAIRDTTRGPYLYRYICGGLPDDDHGASVAQHVYAVEDRRVAAGTLDAVGLRIVAIAS